MSKVDLSETLIVVTADHSHVMTLGGLATPRGNDILGMFFLFVSLHLNTHTYIVYIYIKRQSTCKRKTRKLLNRRECNYHEHYLAYDFPSV